MAFATSAAESSGAAATKVAATRTEPHTIERKLTAAPDPVESSGQPTTQGDRISITSRMVAKGKLYVSHFGNMDSFAATLDVNQPKELRLFRNIISGPKANPNTVNIFLEAILKSISVKPAKTSKISTQEPVAARGDILKDALFVLHGKKTDGSPLADNSTLAVASKALESPVLPSEVKKALYDSLAGNAIRNIDTIKAMIEYSLKEADSNIGKNADTEAFFAEVERLLNDEKIGSGSERSALVQWCAGQMKELNASESRRKLFKIINSRRDKNIETVKILMKEAPWEHVDDLRSASGLLADERLTPPLETEMTDELKADARAILNIFAERRPGSHVENEEKENLERAQIEVCRNNPHKDVETIESLIKDMSPTNMRDLEMVHGLLSDKAINDDAESTQIINAFTKRVFEKSTELRFQMSAGERIGLAKELSAHPKPSGEGIAAAMTILPLNATAIPINEVLECAKELLGHVALKTPQSKTRIVNLLAARLDSDCDAKLREKLIDVLKKDESRNRATIDSLMNAHTGDPFELLGDKHATENTVCIALRKPAIDFKTAEKLLKHRLAGNAAFKARVETITKDSGDVHNHERMVRLTDAKMKVNENLLPLFAKTVTDDNELLQIAQRLILGPGHKQNHELFSMLENKAMDMQQVTLRKLAKLAQAKMTLAELRPKPKIGSQSSQN